MPPVVEITFPNGSRKILSETSHGQNDPNSLGVKQANLFLNGPTGLRLQEICPGVKIKEVPDHLGSTCPEGFHHRKKLFFN